MLATLASAAGIEQKPHEPSHLLRSAGLVHTLSRSVHMSVAQLYVPVPMMAAQ